MTDFSKKILQNILPPFPNSDNSKYIYDQLNSFSPNLTPQINYYQSPAPLNINSPININNSSINDDYNEYSHLQENQLTNIKDNPLYLDYSCQTPIMNLNQKKTSCEQMNVQLYKPENLSSDTDDSSSINSKNQKIEILPKIENIVSTANLGCTLKLREIALQAKNAEYNPKRFSAVIMKIKEPRTTALIFSSGKIVCLGAKTEEESKKACRKFAKIIKSLGYPVIFKEFKFQNIVGSAYVQNQLSLMKLYIYLLKNSFTKNKTYKKLVFYEPEQFPGLIYRMIEPNIVLLIFVSGKIVLTGGKSREDIFLGFRNIYPLLNKFKQIDNLKSNKMLHKDNIEEMKGIKPESIFI